MFGWVGFFLPKKEKIGGGGTANQWDKRQGVNPQFILVFEKHTTACGVHSNTCWRDQDTGREDRASAEIPVKW